MPRAGPLRYWSLTLLGLAIGLGSAAAFGWGLYNLIDTGSCASGGPHVSTRPCPDDTLWHILAVVLAPFAAPFAVVARALRGGGSRTGGSERRRREKRLADRIARGEAAMPTIAAPNPAPPVPSLTPLNRTWPPATWEPKSPVERLRELDELRAKGLITVAEHEAQKKRILGGV